MSWDPRSLFSCMLFSNARMRLCGWFHVRTHWQPSQSQQPSIHFIKHTEPALGTERAHSFLKEMPCCRLFHLLVFLFMNTQNHLNASVKSHTHKSISAMQFCSYYTSDGCRTLFLRWGLRNYLMGSFLSSWSGRFFKQLIICYMVCRTLSYDVCLCITINLIWTNLGKQPPRAS